MSTHFLAKKNIKYLEYLLRSYLPEPLWYKSSRDVDHDAVIWFKEKQDQLNYMNLTEINEEFLKHIINVRRFDDTLGFRPANDPNLITDYYENVQPCDTSYFNNDISCRSIDLPHALATGEYIPGNRGFSTQQIVEELKCGELDVKDFLNDEEYKDVAGNIYRARHTPGKKQVAKRRIIAPPVEYSGGNEDIVAPVFKRFELNDTNTTQFKVCPDAPRKFGQMHQLNELSIRRIEDEAMFGRQQAAQILGSYNLRHTGYYDDELNTVGSGIAPNPLAYTQLGELYDGNKNMVRRTDAGLKYNQGIYQIGQENNYRYNPKSVADNVTDAIEWDKLYKTTAPQYKGRLYKYFQSEQKYYNDYPKLPLCHKEFCGSSGIAASMYHTLAKNKKI